MQFGFRAVWGLGLVSLAALHGCSREKEEEIPAVEIPVNPPSLSHEEIQKFVDQNKKMDLDRMEFDYDEAQNVGGKRARSKKRALLENQDTAFSGSNFSD